MGERRRTAEEKKTELLDNLIQLRGEILAAARQFLPKEETIPFVGIWSLLDLLAHLAGWDVTNRTAAQEILAGKTPSFYAHHGKDWAEYNAFLVAQYRQDSLAKMLATVERTQQELIVYLKAVPAKDLYKDYAVRVRGYKVIISRLLEAEYKDETHHLNQILEFLDKRNA